MKNSSKKSQNTKSKSPTSKPFPTTQSTFDQSGSHSIDLDKCNSAINPLPLSSPMNASLMMASHVNQNKKIQQIDIVDFEFRPKKVNIEANTLVRWTIGENKAPHESGIYSSNTRNFVLVIDALEVESDLLVKGQSFEHCFTAAGIYEIGCSNYPRMKGKVEVCEEGKVNDPEMLQDMELQRRGLYKTSKQFEENFENQFSNKLSVQTAEKKKVKGIHPMVEHFPSYNPHDLQALINELHAQDLSQSKSTYREQQLQQLEKDEKEKPEKAPNLSNQFCLSDVKVNFLDSAGSFPEGGYEEYSSYSDYEYDKVSEFDLSNILKGRKISSPLSLPPVSIFEEQKVGESSNYMPQVINVFSVETGLKEEIEIEIEKERKEEVLGQSEGKIENNSEERVSDKSETKEIWQGKESVEKKGQENQENQLEKENVEEKKKKKKSKTKNKKKKKSGNIEEQGGNQHKQDIGSSLENKKDAVQTKSIEEMKDNVIVKEVQVKAKETVIEKQNDKINANQKEQVKSIVKEKSLGNVMRNGQDYNDGRDKKNKNKTEETTRRLKNTEQSKLRTEYVPKAVQSVDKGYKDKAKVVAVDKPQTPVVIEEKVELKSTQVEEKKFDKQISKSDEFFVFIKKNISEYINNNKRNSRNHKKYKVTRQEEPSSEELERVAMLKAFLLNSTLFF